MRSICGWADERGPGMTLPNDAFVSYLHNQPQRQQDHCFQRNDLDPESTCSKIAKPPNNITLFYIPLGST